MDTGIAWRKIIGTVWTGHTVPEAFGIHGYTEEQRRKALVDAPDMKKLLLDVAMLADYIEGVLDARPTNDS